MSHVGWLVPSIARDHPLTLDLTGWTRVAATGISDDGGTIVGYGENPLGQTEAWMAVIEPVSQPVPTLGMIFRAFIGSLSRRGRAIGVAEIGIEPAETLRRPLLPHGRSRRHSR